MSDRHEDMAPIAEPTIEQVFEEFMAEQRARLAPRTIRHYESVISLLTGCLDSYAYEALDKREKALFEHHFNADGESHKDFCQLFGSDKIVENLGMFLGSFMVRKVMAGADFKRRAGTVCKKLSKWLTKKGYIDAEEAEAGIQRGSSASRDLPNAEKAAMALGNMSNWADFDPEQLPEEDYYDFDHYTIAKLEPSRIWLYVYGESGQKTIGPIAIPPKVSKLLEVGWDISCAIVRIRGKWRLWDVANVYP